MALEMFTVAVKIISNDFSIDRIKWW